VKLGNISSGNPPTWKDLTDTSLWRAAYKAVGRALRIAVRAESAGIPSTKGIL